MLSALSRYSRAHRKNFMLGCYTVRKKAAEWSLGTRLALALAGCQYRMKLLDSSLAMDFFVESTAHR